MEVVEGKGEYSETHCFLNIQDRSGNVGHPDSSLPSAPYSGHISVLSHRSDGRGQPHIILAFAVGWLLGVDEAKKGNPGV